MKVTITPSDASKLYLIREGRLKLTPADVEDFLEEKHGDKSIKERRRLTVSGRTIQEWESCRPERNNKSMNASYKKVAILMETYKELGEFNEDDDLEFSWDQDKPIVSEKANLEDESKQNDEVFVLEKNAIIYEAETGKDLIKKEGFFLRNRFIVFLVFVVIVSLVLIFNTKNDLKEPYYRTDYIHSENLIPIDVSNPAEHGNEGIYINSIVVKQAVKPNEVFPITVEWSYNYPKPDCTPRFYINCFGRWAPDTLIVLGDTTLIEAKGKIKYISYITAPSKIGVDTIRIFFSSSLERGIQSYYGAPGQNLPKAPTVSPWQWAAIEVVE